jgi:hypothetical protein
MNKIRCDKLLRCVEFSGDYASPNLADIFLERARNWTLHCIIFWNVTDNCTNINSAVYNGPTNARVCNKTLIQISHTKTLKIIPTCFDHQMIIIRELFDPV